VIGGTRKKSVTEFHPEPLDLSGVAKSREVTREDTARR
jgi:hypothetical protein